MFQREPQRRSRLPVGVKNFFAAFGDLKTSTGRAHLAQQTRATAWRVADETTRALTAGLGLADVRALLRGEPPVEKPNVREQALSRAFWTHLRPRAYYKSSTKFSHTFGFGFFNVFFAFVQLITGTLLMFFYEPSPERAYASIVQLVTQVPLGQFLRHLHHWSANLLVLFVLLHLLRVYLTGAFKQTRRLTWSIGALLLGLLLAIAFIGYRLPMDNAVTWGNPDDLLRYYLLHTGILPGAGLLLVAAHYYRVARLHGISLPANEEESPDATVRENARARVNYLPELWSRELVWLALALLGLFALAAWGGHAPLGRPFDSTHRAATMSVPWFLLWWQGLRLDPLVLPMLLGLRDGAGIDLTPFYDSALWQGILVPIFLGAVLLVAPYLDALWDKFWGRAPSRLGRQRKLGIALGLFALMGWLAFSLLAYFASTGSPAERIAHEFLPEECERAVFPLLPAECGAVRRIGYAQLPNGTYEVARYAAPSAEPFENMLAQLRVRLAQADVDDARAQIIIEEWQANLKKITLRIVWTPRASSDTGTLERTIYLHRDSAYE